MTTGIEPHRSVEARTVADITRSVMAARMMDLPVAVRSTGHGSVGSVDGAGAGQHVVDDRC
jgi:hypothetical protein